MLRRRVSEQDSEDLVHVEEVLSSCFVLCSWVSLSMVWALVAGVISTFLPLWESRDVFMRAAGSAPANTGNNLPTTATSKQSGQFKTTADDSAHRGQANGIAKV